MPSDPRQLGHTDNCWDEPLRPSSEQPNRPTDPLSNQQLRDVINKTLEQSSRAGASENSPTESQKVIIAVAKHHPQQTELVEIAVATELVRALGRLALPSPIFGQTIAQRSSEIAAQMLADPIASHHLNQAWFAARRAAGLEAE